MTDPREKQEAIELIGEDERQEWSTPRVIVGTLHTAEGVPGNIAESIGSSAYS